MNTNRFPFPSSSCFRSMIAHCMKRGDIWNEKRYNEWYSSLSRGYTYLTREEYKFLIQEIIDNFNIPF